MDRELRDPFDNRDPFDPMVQADRELQRSGGRSSVGGAIAGAIGLVVLLFYAAMRFMHWVETDSFDAVLLIGLLVGLVVGFWMYARRQK